MLVESQRDRIPGYSNWTSKSGNAEGESRWSPELASTKMLWINLAMTKYYK